MATLTVRIEKITSFTDRFTREKTFLSNIYLIKWMCRNVRRLRNNPASPPMSVRHKLVLDRRDGLHDAPESRALQRPAAPCSPHQPQISFSTAGLLWRQNPSKWHRKSLETHIKLSPIRMPQQPQQSHSRQNLTCRPGQGRWRTWPPPLFNPIRPLWGLRVG